MHRTRRFRTTLAATSLAAVAAVAAPGMAAAAKPPQGSTGSSPGLTAARQRLEQQLNLRVHQLQALSADVSKWSSTLSPADLGALDDKLAQATTSINALVASVPNDTPAELRAARRTMVEDNRVFAVLTPEVYEVIEADTVASQAASLGAQETTLQQEVAQLSGQVGYRAALANDRAFVAAVGRAEAAVARVTSSLLAQAPQDFPRDRGLFVRANRQLLAASEALARANYDEALIGLAAGGYTGS